MKKENTLLMIIDYQERLHPSIYDGERIIAQARNLIQAFQVFEIPMIVTEQYPKGLGHTISEIKDCLTDAPVFEKLTFSGFLPEVQSCLTEHKTEQVVLIGTESHICVYQTCRDLLRAGYRVQVVKDTISSRTAANARNGFDLMRDLGAAITNTETLIYEILEAAGTDTFKKILKIVK